MTDAAPNGDRDDTAGPAPDAPNAPSFDAVNTQILDSVAAIQAMALAGSAHPVVAMQDLAQGQAAALGQLQAVIRQQADAAIASATAAAACAQILGAPLQTGVAASPVPIVALHETQARAAIQGLTLLARSSGPDAEAADAALRRIAAAADASG